MNQLGFNAFNQGVQNQMNLAGMMDQNQQGAMGNLTSGAMNQLTRDGWHEHGWRIRQHHRRSCARLVFWW